ncbi:hypothetical protein C0993_005934 [Termitomyces sp. T159_Od127]|nr:hypothetical protein C0993_005934 [Termitomyces sp. T159_Od127]
MSDVNNRLHTLRGEHFRRAQNLARRTHAASPAAAQPAPGSDTHAPAGPRGPKSWTPAPTAAWRAIALSLVVPAPARMPPLTTLCLRLLAAQPPPEFTHDVLPHLAPHLRRDLVRDAAVHAPLHDAHLWAVCAPAGHAAGELVVVAPQATLRDDYFIRQRAGRAPDDDWDTDADAEPLGTLALVSVRLATSTMLSLPPTLTRLALLDLGAAVPLHRLPSTCPQLVVLDLSYNAWLCAAADSERALARVEWGRWHDLRILGLRGCAVSSTILGKLNRGRWDDVEVVH